MNKELKQKLSILDYSAQWIEYNILSIEVLEEQLEVFQNGEDKNTEHYRYATFRKYLSEKTTFINWELENYVTLCKNDKNAMMAGSAMIDVLFKIDLSDEQFDYFCSKLRELGDWSEKTIIRHQLMRSIKTKDVTDELVQECLVTDELVQECLKSEDLIVIEQLAEKASASQLSTISLLGTTKRIRNTAELKLKSKSQN